MHMTPAEPTRTVDAEFYGALLTAKVRYERLLACLERLAARGHLPRDFVDAVRKGESDPDALGVLLTLRLALDEVPRTPRAPTRKLAVARTDAPRRPTPEGWGLCVRDGRAQFPGAPRRPSGQTSGRMRAVRAALAALPENDERTRTEKENAQC